MTPDERARELTSRWHKTGGGVLEELIAAAIKEAVAAERERCAAAIESCGYTPEENLQGWRGARAAIARRIREGTA